VGWVRPRVFRRLEPSDVPAKARLALELGPERGLLGSCGDDGKPLDAGSLGGQEHAGEKRHAGYPRPKHPGLRHLRPWTDHDGRVNRAWCKSTAHSESAGTIRDAGRLHPFCLILEIF
jgi:hypothetical protein